MVQGGQIGDQISQTCHAGSCEFDSRPSRKTHQEYILVGFSYPQHPRQNSVFVSSQSNTNQQPKSRILAWHKVCYLTRRVKIRVNFLQKRRVK